MSNDTSEYVIYKCNIPIFYNYQELDTCRESCKTLSEDTSRCCTTRRMMVRFEIWAQVSSSLQDLLNLLHKILVL